MSVHDDQGRHARVYERYPGSRLQASFWVPGRGLQRRSLGHRDRQQAIAEGRELLALVHRQSAQTPPLLVSRLFGKYLVFLKHHADGEPKTPSYLKDCRTRSQNLIRWFGDRRPEELRPNLVREYAIARRNGEVTRQKVGTQSVRADLVFLKAALQWGTTYESGDPPILTFNPLSGFRIPKEKSPRRPRLDRKAVRALLKVAPRIHPDLPLLLRLAISTGRRLSSLLGLKWSDVDFVERTLTWRKELDKCRRGRVTPIPTEVQGLLQAHHRKQAAIGDTLLFPSRRPGRPISRHLAGDWLKRAFAQAGVAKPVGSLWHVFRRNWATERRQLPLADVLEAGGWNTHETFLRSYAQATMEGMRSVIDGVEEVAQKQARHLG